jgi:hypothetical protein
MRIDVGNKECLRGTGLETTFSHSRCISYRSWVIPTVQRNQNWASRHSYSKHATCQSPGFVCNQFYPLPPHCKEVVSSYLSQLEIYITQSLCPLQSSSPATREPQEGGLRLRLPLCCETSLSKPGRMALKKPFWTSRSTVSQVLV